MSPVGLFSIVGAALTAPSLSAFLVLSRRLQLQLTVSYVMTDHQTLLVHDRSKENWRPKVSLISENRKSNHFHFRLQNRINSGGFDHFCPRNPAMLGVLLHIHENHQSKCTDGYACLLDEVTLWKSPAKLFRHRPQLLIRTLREPGRLGSRPWTLHNKASCLPGLTGLWWQLESACCHRATLDHPWARTLRFQ